MTRDLVVTASFDALYASTVVALRAQSTTPFALSVSGEVFRLNAGALRDEAVASEEEAPQRHVVEVELLDWMKERGVRQRYGRGAHDSYGISFYPFVSSYLTGRVELKGRDQTTVRFVVDVPDSFRILYAQADVTYGDHRSPEPRHAQGTERSQFIFTPPQAAAAALDVDVAIRYSAARLAELISYPTAYYALSLGGIAIATFIALPGVVVAAVGALWTFMLREWSKAKVPRRRTLLSAVYFASAFVAAAWAAIWELAGLPWEVGSTVVMVALLTAFHAAWRRFDRAGVLPRYVSRFWSWWVRRFH